MNVRLGIVFILSTVYESSFFYNKKIATAFMYFIISNKPEEGLRDFRDLGRMHVMNCM